MKKQLLILFLALFTGFGFYSCDKKYQVIPPPTPTSSIRDSFEFNFNENRQFFNVNAQTGGTFTTEQGIIFNVPLYAFKSAAGDTITGTVNIELSEFLTPSQMILQNRTTTSDGEVLVTGGQFKIEFTSNTTPVYVSGDTVIAVAVPTDISDPSMAVFYGTEDATGFVNWLPSVDSAGIIRGTEIIPDTLPNGVVQDYYTFTMDSLSTNWINCDYFYDVPGARTELTVGLPDKHNNSNTMFFIHFANIQSVMSGFFNGQNFVSNGRIPVGTAVDLVMISEIDGDFFSKIVPITVSNGFQTTITLDPTTYADIESDVNDL